MEIVLKDNGKELKRCELNEDCGWLEHIHLFLGSSTGLYAYEVYDFLRAQYIAFTKNVPLFRLLTPPGEFELFETEIEQLRILLCYMRDYKPSKIEVREC